MDYTQLQQKSPHWTRPIDRGTLMGEQKGLVTQHHQMVVKQRENYLNRITPDQQMMEEWERNEKVVDLNELLYVLYDRGLVDLEWEHTK